ncbi:uncharacterized protein LOC115020250 [Cottoperca gobio]|uniref:non-specific serine/threonine protein kinase n=1 Tax=Cottoperca gobio TaxID=56716 RepID=A0A6J2R5N4_COTGO|nr:uncharacterized protein LOC115020250 [Cottoperca gobio]
MDVAKLNEYAQKERLELRYEDVGSVGPDHIRTFTVRAFVNGTAYPDGMGSNKKEAKQSAASNALKCLLEEAVDRTENAAEASAAPVHQTSIIQPNYICWLNEHGQKNRLIIKAVESIRPGPNNATLCCCFVVGDKEYPAASGKTKKEAKEEAAKLAYHDICGSKTTEVSLLSDDGAPASLSTAPSTTESRDAKSKSVPTTTNASSPPGDQIQSPGVKPRIRIAANFQNSPRNSKEDMANFTGKKTENSPSKKTTTQSVISRFTSEFDSIVCLGKGNFGHVFKAKLKLLKKYYAIKIVRCKEIKKVIREVTALSDLHHSNIVRYYTCWLEDSGYQWDSADDSCSSSLSTGNSPVKFFYIQMELCDTKTLRVWIDEKNVQNVKKSLRDSKRREESLTINQQIVNGVEYIHSKMLIHRDLKPANIMFGQDGEVKIGDFGLVTDENDDDAENLIERTVYKGTPSYMAPEQKSRSSIYDRKVDIFALGLIYFELLWNVGHERKAIWDDVRNQKLPQGFPPNFPLENKIIQSMLCVKPEDRPEASKLKMDLEECTRTLTMLKDMCRDGKTFMESGNYIARLNEHVQKTGSKLLYEDVESAGPSHNKTFTQRVVLNGKVYPGGVGKTKKIAKFNAAKNALTGLFGSEHQDSDDTTADESNNSTAAQQQEELDQLVSKTSDMTRNLSVSSQDNSFKEKNYIGLVNHYCQKKNICHTFVKEERSGPAHIPRFFYKLVIDNKDYPVAEGKTAKEAKQNAAQLAWTALPEQTDSPVSKVSVRSTVSEGGAPSLLSEPSTPLEFNESSSQSTSHSIIFKDSSNSFEAQHAVKDKNVGNSQNGISTLSRFTSDYDSMERLGSGAFGLVYKARNKLLKKYFAVKIVLSEEKALREVEALSDLHHPNIVRYYTAWMEDSEYQCDISAGSSSGSYSSSQSAVDSSAKYLYMEMELCETKTLKVWIDDKNAQSPQDSKRRKKSLSIAQQIVSAVEYIHSKKHIHRDLKPENILFGVDGKVKIGDFGLVTGDDDSAMMDRTENKGTRSYMAPEQRGTTYDRKVDIFPLGLIYLELLWKVSSGHERVEVFKETRSQILPTGFLQTFPEENQIIKLMLRKKPEDRPEASELKADLEELAQTFAKIILQNVTA